MSNNTKADEWKKREIGALWRKRLDSGKVMFSGSISVDGEEIRVVGFTVTEKKNPNQPDVKLYIDNKPKSKDQEDAAPATKKNKPKPEQTNQAEEETENDEAPF
jgi:outer membrane biosynthesis protein TonB